MSSSPSTRITANPNDGKEVKETGCDAKAFTVGAPKMISVGRLWGLLELRKSGASGACDRIYWGRFTPGSKNATDYSVDVTIGKIVHTQESEPGQPKVVAYTVGVHGDIGDKIVTCVYAKGNKSSPSTCTSTTVV